VKGKGECNYAAFNNIHDGGTSTRGMYSKRTTKLGGRTATAKDRRFNAENLRVPWSIVKHGNNLYNGKTGKYI